MGQPGLVQPCPSFGSMNTRIMLVQVVDLEVAADHRGSILGDHPTRLQPPQKMFESKLLHQMRNFSVQRPVFIESESSLVGRRQVPNAMWKVCTTSYITPA